MIILLNVFLHCLVFLGICLFSVLTGVVALDLRAGCVVGASGGRDAWSFSTLAGVDYIQPLFRNPVVTTGQEVSDSLSEPINYF
jgi:hypothetical protein